MHNEKDLLSTWSEAKLNTLSIPSSISGNSPESGAFHNLIFQRLGLPLLPLLRCLFWLESQLQGKKQTVRRSKESGMIDVHRVKGYKDTCSYDNKETIKSGYLLVDPPCWRVGMLSRFAITMLLSSPGPEDPFGRPEMPMKRQQKIWTLVQNSEPAAHKIVSHLHNKLATLWTSHTLLWL